jgi:hypothetical protein
MTEKPERLAERPKAPKRPRRNPYESLVEEIRAEEEAWKAEQEAARIAAGEPPSPPVEKWSPSSLPHTWGNGYRMGTRRRRR